MKKPSGHLLYIICLCCFIFFSKDCYAQVKIKFIVVNPSESKRDTIPIKYSLPPEIKPEHVLDKGGFSIEYDVDQAKYCAMGSVELGPKETKTYSIEVEDVWKVPKEKVDFLRTYANEKLNALKGTSSYTVAANITSNIIQRLDDVEGQQDASKPVADRVDAFRVNKKKIDAIENDIVVLEGLAGEAQGADTEKTITISMELQNPYEKKDEFPVKYYLPPELTVGDIRDSAGFDIQYDNSLGKVYLEGNVTLEPKESKRYSIVVKDVWHMRGFELGSIEKEAKKVMEQLIDTPYEKLGTYLSEKINTTLSSIRSPEKPEAPLRDRVAIYRENTERIETARGYQQRLRELLLQFDMAKAGQEGEMKKAATEDVAFGAAKQADGTGGPIGMGVGSAVGEMKERTQQRGGGIKGIRGLKGVILVSQSLFKGWKPEVATTWIIILAIIGFLGLFSFLFYLIWWTQAQKEKKKKPLLEEGEGKK